MIRWFISILLFAACVTAAPERPNIVFLLADDQRADTIAALGNPHIQTPNLDRLARNGFAFNRAYIMGSQVPAVCIPSRAMLLTGRGLFAAMSDRNVIPREFVMWPEVFRRAGYKTIGIGKWHNDRASYYRAFEAGGPIFLGGMGDQNTLRVYDYGATNHRVARTHSTKLFADAAIAKIRANRKQPFVLYVAFTAPHDPRQAPPLYTRRYRPGSVPLPTNFMAEHPFDNGEMRVRDEELLPQPRERDAVKRELAAYYAMITHLDAHVGRILKALPENTIVVYAADNGLALGSHGLLGKQNLYEHSVRVPLIFSGPGISAGQSPALCYLYDVYRTLCELAGVSPPETVQGQSLLPIMQGKSRGVRDSIFGAYRDVQRMIRTDGWKLILYPKSNRRQLFDLAHDPHELVDLAESADYKTELMDLTRRLTALQREAGDPLLAAEKP